MITFALFAILPLGLASWFSRRDLRTGTSMGIAPLLGAGLAFGLKKVGDWFGSKSEQKKGKEDNRAKVEAATLKQTMGEDKRLANLKAAQSILGSAGADYALDPGLVAQLGVQRKYDFSKALADPSVGAGSAFASGLFGDAADTASQYFINKADAAGPGSGFDPWDLITSRSRTGGDGPAMPSPVAGGRTPMENFDPGFDPTRKGTGIALSSGRTIQPFDPKLPGFFG